MNLSVKSKFVQELVKWDSTVLKLVKSLQISYIANQERTHHLPQWKSCSRVGLLFLWIPLFFFLFRGTSHYRVLKSNHTEATIPHPILPTSGGGVSVVEGLQNGMWERRLYCDNMRSSSGMTRNMHKRGIASASPKSILLSMGSRCKHMHFCVFQFYRSCAQAYLDILCLPYSKLLHSGKVCQLITISCHLLHSHVFACRSTQ
jgi:hypothetical protein